MVPNEDIGLDEDELRRLLAEPLPDRVADGAAAVGAEVGGDGADGERDRASAATADARSPATTLDLGRDTGGAATAGSSATLGQDAIDDLLAQARGAHAALGSAPAPRQTTGSGATAHGARAAALGEALGPAPQPTPAQPKLPVTVQPAQFSPLSALPVRRERNPLNDLGILLDVPLHITVELGRADMPVRDILALGPGSVIELDRSAGEVLDVLVNGTLIAQGEVVVVDEQFGIRLTRVFSPNKEILEGLGTD